MPRTICLDIPTPPPLLNITVPTIGDIEPIREFILGAVGPCQDARAFIQSIQPVFIGLGVPICILGCVVAITDIFTDEFPFVDPGALPNMINACACLTGFTPFGFCGMLRGIVAAISAVISCFIGLMSDLVALETQIAALLADPLTAFAGQCLEANSTQTLNALKDSFGPIVVLMDSAEFLFSFVGVPFTPITGLAGAGPSAVIAELDAINEVLNDPTTGVLTLINNVCPP